MAARREPGTTFADTVYDGLFNQFMSGEREADQALNIPALAREFDVSQTPVREALARLEHTGLVRREPLKGYRVAPMFTEQELVKLMEARFIIEPALAIEAAQRVTPEFLIELERTVEELDLAAQEHSLSRHWNADDAFHGLIAKQSANPFLEAAYQAIGGHIRRFRLFATRTADTARVAACEHRSIIEQLKNRDPEGAAEAARTHVTNARQRSFAGSARLKQS